MKKFVVFFACASIICISQQKIYSQIYQHFSARYSYSSQTDEAFGLYLNSIGNPVITGRSDNLGTPEVATIKYNSCGGVDWLMRLNSGGFTPTAQGFDVILNSSNEVIVAGYAYGCVPCGTNVLNLKYSPYGSQIWYSNYGPDKDQSGFDIRFDNNNNIIIGGYTDTQGGLYDYFVVKYDQYSSVLWANGFGASNEEDLFEDMEVDSDGYIYVTGGSRNATTDFDIKTLKIDPSGNLVWERTYNGEANSGDGGKAIEVDSEGNVYIAGVITGYEVPPEEEEATGENIFITLKYNSSGTLLWNKRFYGNETPNKGSWGNDIVLDEENEVLYVTGWANMQGSSTDLTTIKYSMSGSEIWVEQYDYANARDIGRFITLDENGKPVVSGRSQNQINTSNSVYDYITLKYEVNGKQDWGIRYNGPDDQEDTPNDIKVQNEHVVYSTGFSRNIAGNKDYLTVKYSDQWLNPCQGTRPATNNQSRGNRINAVKYISDKCALAVGGDGTIYLTTDNGITWNEKISNVSNNLNSVEFINQEKGFIVGDGGIILFTLDKGETWERRPFSSNHNLNEISKTSSGSLLIAGDNGKLIKADSLFGTYHYYNTDTTRNLSSTFFVNSNTGFAIGNSGFLVKTYNGGESWNYVPLNSYSNLKKICFALLGMDILLVKTVFYLPLRMRE